MIEEKDIEQQKKAMTEIWLQMHQEQNNEEKNENFGKQV